MNPFRRYLLFIWLVAFLTVAPGIRAQREPHIGYVYPAGGQQGTDFEVTVGGQYLDGVTAALVSGEGVRVDVLGHTKPFTQREANQLRQKLRELQKRMQAARKRGRGGGSIKRIAEDLGLEVTNLNEVNELRKKLSDASARLNPQLAESVRLRIQLTPEAGAGMRELRLKAAAGVSNPISFHVGQWPEYRENEPNDRAADSEVPERLPVTINGQILPGDVDRFRFEARKGERLVVAVSARELIPFLADAVPGWFQATLALYDGEGEELAYADDFRFHPDPVIHYEIPADGAYVLEIKDAIYRGRKDFVYRIALGELPFVTSIFPLGGRAGDRTAVDVKGWNLPVSKMSVTAEDNGSGVQSISVRADGTISNAVPFAVDTLPESLEEEPNDEPHTAQRVELPRIVNGRIDQPGDRDVFHIRARAGDEIFAEVEARRLDSPLDSLLKLTDADGQVLAANDDHTDRGAGLTTHHADSRLRIKIPATGDYYLRLVDTQKKGSAAYGYRLRISPQRPDFALRVVPSSINARAGATVPITVHALRKDGFDGDITLRLQDAPQGFALSGGWVPAGQENMRLTLTMPPLPTDEPLRLSLEGHAVIHGEEVCRRAVPAEDMMQAFIYRHLVPSQEWVVAVTGRGRAGSGLTLPGEEPVKLVAGETARVRISGRRGSYAGQIQFELSDPPEGIAIEKVAPDSRGLTVFLRVQPGKVDPGLKGNLIVNAFMLRKARVGGTSRVNTRRIPLGTLPAIPFEVVVGL